ncbi:MAG: hypothetical protein M1828_007258 [Chrysothrix sp. TS-e1954]|nr:MAG: hypothetical protein M1828_007258 [Chrysothrix sp. TS-e1954]
MDSNHEKRSATDFDVVIVGAGISGINAGYRIQTELPGSTYTILEARGDMGGTWDLFRYPGIRSDSDLHTFGFAWRPWTEQKAIADGASILSYMKETASMFDIDKRMQFHHRLITANWSSEQQLYTLEVKTDDETKYYHCNYLIMGTGYYDYKEPLPAIIPGIERFQGPVIHPQFWSHELDYVDKEIVVIGSGATAITLLPNLAEKAKRVTMLQRSPSYVIPLPMRDPIGVLASYVLPAWMVHKLIRTKFLVVGWLFYNFCRRFPVRARKVLAQRTSQLLPDNISQDPHFKPSYDPWDQRMCVCPDGDFFTALKGGKCDVETGTIKTITEDGIEMDSGKHLHADVVVTATGLNMQFAGATRFFVDGEEIQAPEKFLWKGVMLQDLPNCSILLGYPNASWTLGADAATQLTCKLLKNMKANGTTSAVPRVNPEDDIKVRPVLALNSTYVTRAKHKMPNAGDKGPWQIRKSYFSDMWNVRFGDLLTGIQTYRVST